MKKVLGCLFLIIGSLFITMPVNAECDYKFKAELNKMAYKVKADFEFETSPDGTNHYNIYIFNITEDIYVNYKSGKDGSDAIGTNTSQGELDKGTFKFSIPVPSEPTEYTFIVRAMSSECLGDLRKFKLTIPIRNKFYDYADCREDVMEDYYYCKEWMTQKITLTDKEVADRIKSEYKKRTKNEECEECKRQEELARKYAEFLRKKKKAIIIVSVGIGIGLVLMIIEIIVIKRSEI